MTRTLILVPTEPERRVVRDHLPALPPTARMELCGFGIVAAAARTAGLVATLAPERVILVGIAGALDGSIAVGRAALFGSVACHGIGAGSGHDFVPAARLGWPQWPGDPADPREAIGDLLHCTLPDGPRDERAPLLLTVASTSAREGDVALRRALHPDAAAEEMEGFAVAVACRLAGVPLTIVRGISNEAGDRDTSRWRVDEALGAAARLLRTIVGEGE
jgi:futalosine hydrolase